MAEEVKVKVLDIDAQKSTKSIADLKKEIKDLKDKLAGLNEGTEEYNETLAECAEKMHQLKEINEKVAKSSMDFGDTMSDVRGTIAGVSGAIGAVTGMLALMGVEADKDSKLMKIMVAAMSITSGVQAIEQGVKAFGRLTARIKQATTAAKGFQASLGWIAIAVALVASAYMALKDAQDKTEEGAIKAHEARLKRLETLHNKLSSFEHDYDKDAEDVLDNLKKDKFGDIIVTVVTRMNMQSVKMVSGELDRMISDLQAKLEKTDKEITEKLEENPDWKFTEEGIKAITEYNQQRLTLIEMEWTREMQFHEQSYDRMEQYEIDRHNEMLQNLKTYYAAVLKEIDKFGDDVKAADKKRTTDEATEAARRQAAADKANAERLKKLKDEYNLEIAEIKIAHTKGEIDNVEYYQKLYDALVAHNKRMLRQVKLSQAEIKQAELAEAEAAAAAQKAILDRYEKEVKFTIDREYEGYSEAVKKMKKQVEQRIAIERELTNAIYGEEEKRRQAIENIREMLSSVDDGWADSPYWQGFQRSITMAFETIVGGAETALPWLERINDYFADAASSKAAEKWANSIITSTKWIDDVFSGEGDRVRKALSDFNKYIEEIGDTEMSQNFRKSFLENAQWIDNLLSGEESKVAQSISELNSYIEQLGDVDVSDEWIVNLMKDEQFLTNLFSNTAEQRARALKQYKEMLTSLGKAEMSEEWRNSIMNDEAWMTKFVSNSVNDRKEAIEELNEWLMNEGSGTEAARKWGDNMDWMAKVTSQDFTYVYEAYKEFFTWLGGDALNTLETDLNEFQVIQAQMLSENIDDRLKAVEQMHALLLEREREFGAIYVEQMQKSDNMYFFNEAAMKRNMDDAATMEEFLNRMINGSLSDRQRAFDEYAKWEEKRNDERILAELEDEEALLDARGDILESNRDAQLHNLETEYQQRRELIMNELNQENLDLDRREELMRQEVELENEVAQARMDINLQYASDRQQLELDITENEREQAMQRIAMAKSEKEKKQQLLQSYASAATSIMSYTSQLISALQSNLDTTTEEGFEKNKNYERANATISFLQGLVSAWASAMQLTYPANVIVGAANSALLTGIYAANLAQINSTTLQSSGGSAASTNAVTVQSIEHSPTNVRQTTTSSDYEELDEREGDRRVYVLASDIEEVTGGRKAQVSNATY